MKLILIKKDSRLIIKHAKNITIDTTTNVITIVGKDGAIKILDDTIADYPACIALSENYYNNTNNGIGSDNLNTEPAGLPSYQYLDGNGIGVENLENQPIETSENYYNNNTDNGIGIDNLNTEPAGSPSYQYLDGNGIGVENLENQPIETSENYYNNNTNNGIGIDNLNLYPVEFTLEEISAELPSLGYTIDIPAVGSFGITVGNPVVKYLDITQPQKVTLVIGNEVVERLLFKIFEDDIDMTSSWMNNQEFALNAIMCVKQYGAQNPIPNISVKFLNEVI